MRLLLHALILAVTITLVQDVCAQETSFSPKQKKLIQKYKPFFTKDAQLIYIDYIYIIEKRADSVLVKKIINPDKLVKTHEIEYHNTYLSTEHGSYTEWYDNGNIWVKGEYHLGKKQGVWRYYSHKNNGKPRKAGTFINDKKEGAWTFQTKNERVITNYKAGKKDGYKERYDSLKNLEYKALYRNDSLINVLIDKNPKKREMPHFKGGDKGILRKIAQKITYPSTVKDKGIEGTVKLKFVVEKDGSIGEVVTLRGVCNSLEKASVRAVKKLPRFKPGELNGKKVSVWYQVPIEFKLKYDDE
ncbi:TonB family protein [Balneicella halophila]|uniref:TonB family protein n=1 Tax=Balneicella halophila TaxID=1537566 RepID=A0A7L4UQF1_BALHA|nr:energy transducer TonB [Balneicella halophila]PVX51973.1 TonB family protein [Balneicella halophila]